MAPPDVYAEAAGVSKWYGDAVALDGVDLTVRAGTVHGLVGPNGAGKTTLLAALLGLVVPDEGVVRLFGRAGDDPSHDWLDGAAGFVEAPRFYPYLTGRQNLRALARLDDGAPPRIDDVLREVGLEAKAAAQRVRGYSLGMRQRLGLAAALLRRPRLLILDEPTNGLDPVGTREVRATIRRLAGSGAAVLLSSHDMTQVEQLCDSVTVLSRGRVAFDGDIAELRAQAPAAAWLLHTSDDVRATALAGPDLAVIAGAAADGLQVVADQAELDAYVVLLGRAGVAVRALRQSTSPLEALFFRLVGDGPAERTTEPTPAAVR